MQNWRKLNTIEALLLVCFSFGYHCGVFHKIQQIMLSTCSTFLSFILMHHTLFIIHTALFVVCLLFFVVQHVHVYTQQNKSKHTTTVAIAMLTCALCLLIFTDLSFCFSIVLFCPIFCFSFLDLFPFLVFGARQIQSRNKEDSYAKVFLPLPISLKASQISWIPSQASWYSLCITYPACGKPFVEYKGRGVGVKSDKESALLFYIICWLYIFYILSIKLWSRKTSKSL